MSIVSLVAVLVCTFLISFVRGISPLSITGTKFFNAEGQQVFFKGMYTLCVWFGL